MFETVNSHVQQSQQAFRSALNDQITRLQAMYEEIGRLEEAGLKLAASTIDGTSALVKQSLGAGESLAASGRQAVKDAAKPAAPLTEALGVFRKLADDHAARVASCCDQVARFEHDGAGRAGETLDEYGRMLKESLRYGTQLAGEWRKLTVEAAKRTADAFTPGV